MSDYSSFRYGGVVFPLATGDSLTALRVADPALFYTLEFYTFCIEKHIGPRLMAEVASGDIVSITSPVADVAPFNPAPFFIEDQLKFPLLSGYRKTTRFEWTGTKKNKVDEVEISYVLPPMQVGEAERLMPILNAVVAVLDNRTETGFDPDYTPTQPAGTAGEPFWQRAGVVKAGVKSASYGGFMPDESLYYPAVMITVELVEQSNYYTEEFEVYDGIDAHVDIASETEDDVQDVAFVYVQGAPTVTLAAPSSGTKAGGTTVTLTGTNFSTSLTPRVYFGAVRPDLEATNVTVLSATSLQCKTPAHTAYPTSIEDVIVVDENGQEGRLVAGFTFTTP